MLSNSSWYCSRQLSKQFSRPLSEFVLGPKKHSYCPQAAMFRDIRRGLLAPQGGLNLICAPTGAGKTTTLLRTLNEMRLEREIRGALYTSWQSLCVSSSKTTLGRLKSALGISPLEKSHSFSDLLPDRGTGPPIVLVLDQFDHALCDEECKSFLVGLAEESVLHKKFIVLLSSGSVSMVQTILGFNGGTKIHDLSPDPKSYRWDDEKIGELVRNMGGLKSFGWSDQSRQYRLLRAFAKAGTPGFVLDHIASNPAYLHLVEKEAEAESLLWDIKSPV